MIEKLLTTMYDGVYDDVMIFADYEMLSAGWIITNDLGKEARDGP